MEYVFYSFFLWQHDAVFFTTWNLRTDWREYKVSTALQFNSDFKFLLFEIPDYVHTPAVCFY